MEKRILINENRNLFNKISSDLKEFQPLLNELKVCYEALEISSFTNDVFKKLVLVGTNEFKEKYIEKLNSELDKAQITSSLIRKNAIESYKEVIIKLDKALQETKSFRPVIYANESRPRLTLNFITFENGFLISKYDKEDILETYCRIYLDNEDEIKNLNSIKKLQESFNEYIQIVQEANVPNFNPFLSMGHVFDLDENGKAVINTEGVKNLSTYQKRRQNYESDRKNKKVYSLPNS